MVKNILVGLAVFSAFFIVMAGYATDKNLSTGGQTQDNKVCFFIPHGQDNGQSIIISNVMSEEPTAVDNTVVTIFTNENDVLELPVPLG